MTRMNMTSLLASLWRNRRGTAAAEFAVTLPILLAMGLGAVETGRLLYQYHVLTKAVDDAAHYAARLQDCTWAVSDAALNTTTVNLVKSGNPAGTPYLLPQWADIASSVTVTTTTFDNSAGAYRGGPSLPVIVVRAAVPASSAILSALGYGGSLTFRVSHEERCIGS
jgi:Flp pilus assembly protein TadG